MKTKGKQKENLNENKTEKNILSCSGGSNTPIY